MQTRYVDNENGRIFYLNEDSGAQYVIFYIHGGGYLYDIIPPRWRLIDKIIGGTDAQIVVPAYRLVPFATYKEAYELIVPEYKRYVEACPDKKIILMGDSAGGGLALALTECFKQEGIRNVTTFVGTSEIFYPDVVKLYHMLDQDPSNELIVAEEMNHVYPLYPIPEAKPAVDKIIRVVMR